jgi:hypothetical protein
MLWKFELRKAIRLSAAVILAVTASGAHANEEGEGRQPFLEGDFAYTTTGFCIESAGQPPGTGGFDPVTLQLLTPGQFITLTGMGTLHFKRDGSLTLVGTAGWELPALMAAGDNPVLTNLSQSSEVGTYVLGPADTLSITQTFRQDVNSSTHIIVAPTKWAGFVTGGKLVNLMLKQNIETLTTFVNGAPVQENQVICSQTLIASKVGR